MPKQHHLGKKRGNRVLKTKQKNKAQRKIKCKRPISLTNGPKAVPNKST